ncbi:MAG: exodeoxyribonuclease VII small subunit [Candidatus Moranbacteria bacterium]|nr:exodeoxyribonuclease VII small subunit [Candidatus Moranbacteria bacterium]
MTTKKSLNESLKKLETIVRWFDDQEAVDVEQGLQKVKEGALLIQESKIRLKEIENEFITVKKELEKEE